MKIKLKTMEELIEKLAEIAKIAGDVLNDPKSDATTRANAGNIQQIAMTERGRIINNSRKES